MADTAIFPSLTLNPAPAPKRFTWDDMLAMMAAGVIASGGPEELLDGEIWVTPSAGPAHGDLKA